MTYRNASAPAKSVSRMLAAIAAVTATFAIALAVAVTSPAFAQTPTAPAPSSKAKEKEREKERERAAKKNKGAPPAQPEHPAQAGQPQQQNEVQLIYSPWTKFCLKGKEADAKQVCFTGKDARIESGMPVVAAVIIEPEGTDRKILRVTLPLGMQLVHGTRVIVDQNQPMTAPYVICFTNGCMADYEATTELINKMKKGQGLIVQAINSTGQPISLPLPLADFAKAYDGPPTDPKVFEEQQKKLQEELQKRADEARKRLELQGSPSSSASPPGKTQ
jgi:invasion protein IalB